ncbi:hypothetical protein ACIF83_16230 [Streptomyces sp. NPDC085866]|uniref:hypothetical protein n=1 Tax=Streptomyces sp. NPDC085866 TaxID=3365736 RepID=UPI0037CF5CFE
MPDLLWDDVADWFDPEVTGTLPDLRVPGASTADWQAVLDLVRDSGLRYCYEEGGTVLPLPRAAAVLSRPAGAECPNLSVWLTPDIVAIFRLDPEGAHGHPMLGYEPKTDRVLFLAGSD